MLSDIYDGSKLTVEKWELIDKEGISFFDSFPFFDDPKFKALTPHLQRYLLAYSLRDLYGYREEDAYRYARQNFVSTSQNCASSVNRWKHLPHVKYFLEKIDWARVEAMGFSARKIVEAETNLSYSDITAYLDDDGCFSGKLKELPPGVRRAIKSFEVITTTDKEGTETKKFKISLWDKGQSLHRMQKMKGMHVDRVENTSKTTTITGEMTPVDAAKAYADMMKR
jgi:hypothetical protein